MISDKEAQKLRDKVKELEEMLEKERKVKDKIVQEKKRLEKEFEEFKAKHSITVSNLRQAMKVKADKKVLARPLGAPKGHKGYARHIPERIDYIKELNPKKCPNCGAKLGVTTEIRYRYVTDLKLFRGVKTTQYNIHRKYCLKCRKIVEPEVPGVLPYARFGLYVMLLVMYLKLGLRLPGNKICDYLTTIYNLKISEGEIVNILRQLVVAFGDYYIHLEKLVKSAKVKYSDTTSWRVDGKNYFAWVFITYGVVLYKIRKRNNHKVGLALFDKNQRDCILVVDRHAAFRTLAEKRGFKLQLCWSHIIKNSKGLAQEFGAEGKYVHRRLKEIYDLAKALNHKGTLEMVEQLNGEIFQLTARHYKHSIVRKFVHTLFYRDGKDLFRFVTNAEIDPTNNISERELRALVIIRKISNGSRSSRGANATAMLLSIIQTLRFNRENVLQGLQAILKNPSGY